MFSSSLRVKLPTDVFTDTPHQFFSSSKLDLNILIHIYQYKVLTIINVTVCCLYKTLSVSINHNHNFFLTLKYDWNLMTAPSLFIKVSEQMKLFKSQTLNPIVSRSYNIYKMTTLLQDCKFSGICNVFEAIKHIAFKKKN